MQGSQQNCPFPCGSPIGFVQALRLLLPASLLILGDSNMYQLFFAAKTEAIQAARMMDSD